MTLPTESVLNWSTEKPTFEEVEGRRVVVQWNNNRGECEEIKIIKNKSVYHIYFEDSNAGFVRYAIIAEPLVAKELWGIHPVLHRLESGEYWILWSGEGDIISIETHSCMTKAEAITAWNQLVEKIQGER